ESTTPLLKNLTKLIPDFRVAGGLVIWVQALYDDLTEAQAPAGMTHNEKGSDKWLTSATHVYHISCCKSGTFGAEIHPDLRAVADIEKDKVVTKAYYSAFQGTTELLDVLRGEKIQEAYFCGIASGTCVLASVLHSVEYKEEFKIFVVADCLGYRRITNHEEAIERMGKLEDVAIVGRDDMKLGGQEEMSGWGHTAEEA
ncbi:cysteine hydrolase, partial [Candidatus Bathyarchaeota archaeon]|nr:cysteine hydrolase [Candidatus Bathyarchaeota archaeon]